MEIFTNFGNMFLNITRLDEILRLNRILILFTVYICVVLRTVCLGEKNNQSRDARALYNSYCELNPLQNTSAAFKRHLDHKIVEFATLIATNQYPSTYLVIFGKH